MNRDRTPEQREAAIQRRLLQGKMPYARDAVGQPPARIQAWAEHVENWVPPPPAVPAIERVEVSVGGKLYRVSGSPTIRSVRYPVVEVWVEQKTNRRKCGDFVQPAHWKAIHYGQRRDLVLIRAVEQVTA